MAAGFTTGIQVNLGLNPRAFQAGLEATKARVKAFSSQVGKTATDIKSSLGGAFQKIGKDGVAMLEKVRGKLNQIAKYAALAGAALSGLLLKKMSSLASQAEETASKFNVVFRGVEQQANIAVQRFHELGLSITEARGSMARLQDTFVPFGFARQDAVRLSEAVTQLSLDLASFDPSGMQASEALDLLTSALVGNHEAVRRFGILITQATLDQELLALGFKKSTQGATEQQKVIARLSLMFKSSGDAMGDFERTQDSFANTMRRLKSRLTAVLEVVGKDFNNWLLETINRMGGVEGVAATMKGAIDSLKGTFRAAGESMKDFFESAAEGRGQMGWLIKAFETLNVAGQGLNVSFRTVAMVLSGYSEPAQKAYMDSIYESQKAIDQLIGRESEYVKIETRRRKALEELRNTQQRVTEQEKESNDAKAKANALIQDMKERLSDLDGQASLSASGLSKVKKELQGLIQEREKLAKDFEKRGFEVGFSGLQTQEQQLAALHQRAAEFRNKADTSKMRGDLEAAKDALLEFAALIERINSVEGGTNAAFRQQELRDVATEVDSVFQKQISEQEQLQTQMQRIAADAERFRDAMEAATQSTSKLASDLSGVTVPTPQGMAGGGRVLDPRDKIPALLRHGETVITPEQSNRLAPLLAAAGVPGFAGGGNFQFRDMLQGARRYSAAGSMLRASEDRQLSNYRAQQLKALIEQYGMHKASELMIKQRQAGIPIVPEGFSRDSGGFFEGMANGGRVGGTQQTFNFGGTTIEYHSTGGSATDAVAIAGQIQRAVKRNLAQVN